MACDGIWNFLRTQIGDSILKVRRNHTRALVETNLVVARDGILKLPLHVEATTMMRFAVVGHDFSTSITFTQESKQYTRLSVFYL